MALELEDYKVGWITALPIEAAAAKAMLDAIHPKLPTPPFDSNIYTFGHTNPCGGARIGGHNVVIASGRPGTTAAATVANDMRRTFPWLRVGLMVGIAGGVWHPDTDVRLGDVVVGVHPKGEAGVVQYDYGRQIQDKAFIMTGSMNKAPDLLLNAVAAVQAVHSVIDETEMEYVAYLEQNQATKFSKRPVQDRLFSSTYVHPSGSCDDCDKQQLRDRPQRTHPMIPKVHYGPIASGNRLIRDPDFAETARKKYSILCFEMEAAGLDNFPSLTIRGISDYCDTHKNDDWHQYAALAAAAYAKELLSVIQPTAVVQLPQLGNTYWNVPRARNPRRSLLDNMKKYLITERRKKDISVFVLQGMGGAGKSEAAMVFATENQDSFWGVFWINARSRQSIEHGFAEIANMQIPPLEDTTPRNVTRWLATNRESWLLILDECDDAEIDFARYIPSRGGSVIVTTRLTECRVHGTWENVDNIGTQHAVQLLLEASGLGNGDQKAYIPAAELVVSVLGQHALALIHAGAYVKKGYCSLSEYAQFFGDAHNRLLEYKPIGQASRSGSVHATFDVSAKALASSDRHCDHLALKLLNILAFLDRGAVDEEIFVRAFDHCIGWEDYYGFEWKESMVQRFQCCPISSIKDDSDHNGLEKLDSFAMTGAWCSWRGEHCRSDASHDIPGADDYVDTKNHELGENYRDYHDDGEICHLDVWHCFKVRSSGLVERQKSTRLRDASIRLADLSLIKFENHTISMHPLVHEWARTRLSEVERQDAWEQALSVVALSSYGMDRTPFIETIVPHMDTCVRDLGRERSHSLLSLNVARALFRLAECYELNLEHEASLAIFQVLSVSPEILLHTQCYRNSMILRRKADGISKRQSLVQAKQKQGIPNVTAEKPTGSAVNQHLQDLTRRAARMF